MYTSFDFTFTLSIPQTMKYILCLLILAMGCSIHAQDSMVYQTSQYIIHYDKDWAIDTSGNAGTDFMILSKLQDEEDQYEDALTLTTLLYNASENALKTFSEQHINDLKLFYQEITISNDEYITHGGAPCRHYVVKGKFSNVGVILEEYVWAINDKVYLLTYNSQTEGYEKLSETAKKMFQSFRFKI